jgi:hypothetical protein
MAAEVVPAVGHATAERTQNDRSSGTLLTSGKSLMLKYRDRTVDAPETFARKEASSKSSCAAVQLNQSLVCAAHCLVGRNCPVWWKRTAAVAREAMPLGVRSGAARPRDLRQPVDPIEANLIRMQPTSTDESNSHLPTDS